MNEANLEKFWYWINERHRIYVERKNGKPRPWTKDPILHEYRFCNVYRELDTVTIWIRKNWREPFKDHPNLWFALAVARQINWPATLEKIGFPTGDLREWCEKAEVILARMQNEGEKIYGGAYIITAGGRSGPKYLYTMRSVLLPIAIKPPKIFLTGRKYSLKIMWEELRQHHGFGPFIAYEVVSDLRWTRYYNGTDHMTWANPGPGAKRGLGRLFGDGRETRYSNNLAIALMNFLLKMSEYKLEPWMSALEMRDIEHSLCETDKYLRVLNKEGRMKAVYGRKP